MSETITVVFDYIYGANCGSRNSPEDRLSYYAGTINRHQGKITGVQVGTPHDGRVQCQIQAEICRASHRLLMQDYDLFVETLFGDPDSNGEVINFKVHDGKYESVMSKVNFIKNMWK